MNGDWSAFEDARSATSRLNSLWTAPEEMSWAMEVRDTIGSAGSMGLAEIGLRGSFTGKLFIKIISILDEQCQ